MFTLAKPLMVGLTYPYDWGFIPSTQAEDGDPLDVLIIHVSQTYPGVVLRCRPIGILEILQKRKGKEERNDRIFAAPERSPLESNLEDQGSAVSRRRGARTVLPRDERARRQELKFLEWRGPGAAVKAIRRLSIATGG